MDYMKIYQNSPILLQNIACFVEGKRIQCTRYNKSFKKIFSEYMERNQWSYEQICEYRDTQLKRIIAHAYNTVPYYKNFFNESGLDYKSISRIEDLKKLPIITKQEINKNPQQFVSTAFPSNKYVKLHTSGTTGSGFKFYSSYECIHNQWAAFWRARKELGIDFDTWCGQFASRIVVPVRQQNPPFWRYNIPGKQIYFSAYHESDKNLYAYYNTLKKYRIKWIHGYPSLITPLANFIVDKQLEPLKDIQFVTTGAENLYQFQKNNIQKAFGVTPREVYGQSENVAIITERNDGKLVVEDDFSAVEFIPNREGEFQIIGTTLFNYAMPLIRYNTRDLISEVRYDSNKQRRCISNIDGRSEDYIYLPDGRKIGKLDHVFKDTTNFSEVQIYQRKNYEIIIYAVRSGEDWKKDQELATNLLIQSLGKEVDISFRYVSCIPKTKGGKVRFVISELTEHNWTIKS